MPTGYAVTSWRAEDQSWNGGTFNAKNGSRGERINIKSSYSRFDSTLQDYKSQLDVLSRDVASVKGVESKAEAQRKIDIASKELQQATMKVSQVGNYDSNIDYIEMQAHSWYTCTSKVFGSCVDGRGNHGKGRVITELVFIGDDAQISSTVENVSASVAAAKAAVQAAKEAPLAPNEEPKPESNSEDGGTNKKANSKEYKRALRECKQRFAENTKSLKKCISKAKKEYSSK